MEHILKHVKTHWDKPRRGVSGGFFGILALGIASGHRDVFAPFLGPPRQERRRHYNFNPPPRTYSYSTPQIVVGGGPHLEPFVLRVKKKQLARKIKKPQQRMKDFKRQPNRAQRKR